MIIDFDVKNERALDALALSFLVELESETIPSKIMLNRKRNESNLEFSFYFLKFSFIFFLKEVFFSC